MVCVWWDSTGSVYWELLKKNTTVNAKAFTAQLQRVDEILSQRPLGRGQIYYIHGNAKPHTAKLTQKKLQALGWEVMVHPPYSPDIAPSNFYLFRSLSHHTQNRHFDKLQHL
jgi:[histone H3]-lysine36 N-dimethyltransferase SETMAR